MDWINVKSYLPEPFVPVLCYMPGEKPFSTVHEGYLSGCGEWLAGGYKRAPGEVTHWTEIPVFPGDDEE